MLVYCINILLGSNLNLNLERMMVMLVIVSFAFTSINIFAVQGFSLTREEAIEISRNSKLVRNLLEGADYYTLEVHYLNKTQVNEAREEYPWLQKYYPKDRSVWTVSWYIHPEGAVSAFRYGVWHVIDAETGQILHEGSASAR